MITKEVRKDTVCLPIVKSVNLQSSPHSIHVRKTGKRLAVVVLAHLAHIRHFLGMFSEIRPLRGRWALLLAVVS